MFITTVTQSSNHFKQNEKLKSKASKSGKQSLSVVNPRYTAALLFPIGDDSPNTSIGKENPFRAPNKFRLQSVNNSGFSPSFSLP
jgi:hypothetical protein